MFSGIKNLIGVVTIHELDDLILVEGVPGYFIEKDIQKLWKTSRLSAGTFEKITRNSFSFHKFFTIDIVYILEEFTTNRKVGAGNARTARKILDALYEHTWLKNTKLGITRNLDYSKQKLFYKSPLAPQEAFFKKYDTVTAQYQLKGYLLNGAPGSGKAQPLDAHIKIPGGWTTMGEIKVGDTITSKNGGVTKVTGVYPQAKKEVYRLTFSDGRTTEACGEHLWNITRRKRISKNEVNQYFKETVNTYKLIEYLQGHLEKRIYIDLPDSEEQPNADLPIDPYLLGVLLGDGGITTMTPSITTPDVEIIEEIKKVLPENTKINFNYTGEKCPRYSITAIDGRINNLTSSLNELGLFGKRSYEKSIPDIYLLNTSTQQRLALLQGLMDTDGTINKQGAPSYSTTSYDLALKVQYLVRSLGGIASIGSRIPTFTYKNEKRNGRLAYQVNIRFKKPSDLFRLPKKKERTNDQGQYCNTLKLRLDSITPVGYKECQCISVDSPDHLYITNQFIVTHNTYMSMVLAEMLHSDHVIVICPINALYRVWKNSIETEYRDPPTFWIAADNKPYLNEKIIVCHYESLSKIQDLAKTLKGKITIILDESHNLNEITSARTQLFIELCNNITNKDVLWASGTPIKALGSESIPLLLTIDPFFTRSVAEDFKKIYGRDATKATDILSNRIQLISHVIEKKELNLQPPIIETFKVKISNGDDFTLDKVKEVMVKFIKERTDYYNSIYKESEEFFFKCIDYCEQFFNLNKSKYNNELINIKRYKQYVKLISDTSEYHLVKNEMKFCSDFEKQTIVPMLPGEWKEQFKDVKSIIKYVKLKIQGECLGRILGRMRIDCVKAISKGIDYVSFIESTQKKTLIFTSYVDVLEDCKDTLISLGQKPLLVYGKTNKDLNDTIEKFAKDETLNPLVATYASLSTAVPLTMADVMIMVNPAFRDYIHQQAISRLHRLGSNTQVYVWIASLDTGNKPNLSSRTIDILKWSQEQVAAITGVKSPFEVEAKGVVMESIDNDYIDDFMYKEVSLEEYFIDPTLENLKQKPTFLKW